MRRLFAMVCMMLAVVMFALGAPIQAQAAGKPLVMKLGHANAAGDIKDLVSIKMAELAKEKTNGRLIIEVYPGGQLGDWRELVEGLRMNMNEILIESVGTINSYTPLANIEAAPYLFRDNDHFKKVWFSPLGEKILKIVGDDGGFTLLGPMNRGPRVVTSKVPFKNLAELKGLKIRVPNISIYQDTWKALGGAPMPLALTEVFTALQQNTVDAQENPTIESYGHSFYDVCPYLIETNHVFGADVFIFDKKYFEALPDDIKKPLIEAINEAAAWRNEELVKNEIKYKKMFQDKGVTIIAPDRAEFMKACEGLVERVYPALADLAAEIRAVK